MNTERWLPIDGFPGYEVSDAGRVRRGDRIKALRPPRKGHNSVALWVNQKPHTRLLGPLVAAAFIGPKPAGMVVRHDNGNGLDDRASNLLYGTSSENEQDKRRHGTAPVGENHPSAKLTDEQIVAIRQRCVIGSHTHGAAAIGRELNVSANTVWKIATRKLWVHL